MRKRAGFSIIANFRRRSLAIGRMVGAFYNLSLKRLIHDLPTSKTWTNARDYHNDTAAFYKTG
jgi:hypothetical protein